MTPLQFIRRRKKLFRSQAEAAEALGVTPGCVGHWETGRSKIPMSIEKLLDCLKRQAEQ